MAKDQSSNEDKVEKERERFITAGNNYVDESIKNQLFHIPSDIKEELDKATSSLQKIHEGKSLDEAVSESVNDILENPKSNYHEIDYPDSDEFADALVEAIAARFVEQSEGHATQRAIDRVKSVTHINRFLKNQDSLVHGILHVLRESKVTIPIGQSIEGKNYVLKTIYSDFMEDRPYKIKELLTGLIYAASLFGSNSRKITRLEESVAEYQEEILELNVMLKERDEDLKKLDNLLVEEQNKFNSQIEHIQAGQPQFVLFNSKKKLWVTKDEEGNYFSTDKVAEALKFTSYDETKKLRGKLVARRNKAKNKKRSALYRGPKSPHKYRVMKLVMMNYSEENE